MSLAASSSNDNACALSVFLSQRLPIIIHRNMVQHGELLSSSNRMPSNNLQMAFVAIALSHSVHMNNCSIFK